MLAKTMPQNPAARMIADDCHGRRIARQVHFGALAGK
jgi:hypothetical protein